MSSDLPKPLKIDNHSSRIIEDVDRFGVAVGGYVLWRMRTTREALGPTATIAEMLLYTVIGQYLYRKKDPYVGVAQVIKDSGLPASTASRIIGKFIELGFLRQEIDPEDRRKRVLKITEKGLIGGSNALVKRRRMIMEHTLPYHGPGVKR